MPELPDVHIFSGNLKKLFTGKQLNKIILVNGKKLKDSQKDLSKNLQGLVIKDIYRSGKELRFLFSNGKILGVHLMLTGDIFIFDAVTHVYTLASTRKLHRLGLRQRLHIVPSDAAISAPIGNRGNIVRRAYQYRKQYVLFRHVRNQQQIGRPLRRISYGK